MKNRFRKIALICLTAMAVAVSADVYSQTPDTTVFKSETKVRQKQFDEFFEKFPPEKMKGAVRLFIESRFVMKGDSTRIKFAFNPAHVSSIKVETAGAATREDIKKGRWTAVVKPVRSGYLKVVTRLDGANTSMGSPVIIVLEPDEYKEVRTKADEFEAKGDLNGFNEYFNSKYSKYIRALPMF